MANKILNLIFRAKDEATPVMKDLIGAGGDKGIGGIGAALDGLARPAAAALAVLTAVGLGVADMMMDWQDYVLDIDNFAASLGITTEEASGLKGIMDTYDIADSTMLALFKTMAEEGLPPTIEGLISIRDRLYEADGATLNLEAAFGLLGTKGVEELGPMFADMTDDKIAGFLVAMGNALVVTEDMTEEAILNRDAVAALATDWQGLKLSVMGWAAPGLTSLIELLSTPFSSDSAAAFINKFFGLGPGDMPDLSVGDTRERMTQRYIAPAAGGGSKTGWSGVQEGWQTGGSFQIGGSGGPDSQRVSFMGSPGEQVNISKEDSMGELLLLMRRMPILIADAVERVL